MPHDLRAPTSPTFVCNPLQSWIKFLNYEIEAYLPGVCAVFDSAFLQRNYEIELVRSYN